eukprot:scaffold906_cov395-Prasinococcus_capsulatus_cf.AAC.10
MERLVSGVTIIHADFYHLYIETGKYDIESANVYLQSITNTIQANDLFEFLTLSPYQYWHTLLFKDRFNFGGIKINLHSEEGIDGAEAEDGAGETAVISHWNIVEYLPVPLQDYVLIIVCDFFRLPLEHRRQRQRGFEDEEGAPTQALALEREKKADDDYLRELVSKDFTRRTLELVNRIQNDLSSGRAHELQEFPDLAGSHLQYRSPSLEIVKTITQIMSLDKTVEHEVGVMRRNLLRLLQVREFSKEATFQDPCLTFTLNNVICKYCNECADLDLCRDNRLRERRWECAACSHAYDKDWIEDCLVQLVQRDVRKFQLQDLRCKKCRKVKVGHLNATCQCSNGFVCESSPDALHEKMAIFQKIAAFHGFKLLSETLQYVLDTASVLR